MLSRCIHCIQLLSHLRNICFSIYKYYENLEYRTKESRNSEICYCKIVKFISNAIFYLYKNIARIFRNIFDIAWHVQYIIYVQPNQFIDICPRRINCKTKMLYFSQYLQILLMNGFIIIKYNLMHLVIHKLNL